jgi:inner membrane protein
MATIVSHFIVGWGLCRFAEGGRASAVTVPITAGMLAMVPDLDSLLMPWVAYGDPWGHRGMTHSLLFAGVVGLLAAIVLRNRVTVTGGFAGVWAMFAAVIASHGLLDAMTDGGLGVAFFAPFDDARHFLPVRPIPVSPITVDPTIPRVWHVIGVEAMLLWPAAALLMTIRRPMAPFWRCVVVGLTIASAVVWGLRCR